MEHTWIVWKQDVKEDGYIHQLHWTLESNDGKHTVASSGTLKLSGGGGVPVEMITPKLYEKWVKDILGPEKVSHFELHNERSLQKRN